MRGAAVRLLVGLLVGVLAVIAAGLATAGLDSGGTTRMLAASAAPSQNGDVTPCATPVDPDDRSRDVDDDSDIDCESEAALRDSQHITICHGTGNGDWKQISPDDDGVVNGHADHPTDIIPPFDYEDHGQTHHFPGKNWDASGQAIWKNGCEEPEPPPTCTANASVTATDSGGAPREQFTSPEQVYATGVNMPSNKTLSFTVSGDNGGSFASGSVPSGSGNFTALVWDGSGALTGTQTYTVTFSTTGCSRGDTFQYSTPQPTPKPKLIVRKSIVGAPGKPASDFSFRVNQGPPIAFEADSENELTLAPGPYVVTEVPTDGFTTTRSNCKLVLIWPQETPPVCDIMNTAQPAIPLKLRVHKIVTGSSKPASDFSFRVDGGDPTPFSASGVNELVVPAGTHNVAEVAADGFTTTKDNCTNIQVSADQTTIPTCTITNTANVPQTPQQPVGVFVKCVDNFADGTFQATFGYESLNAKEVTIAIGQLNNVTPPDPVNGPNRGQPSTFEPGNVGAAFSVSGAAATTITWRLTSPAQQPGGPPIVNEADATAEFEAKCSEPPPTPKPIVTVSVSCVENTGSTYTAKYGYENPGTATVDLPVSDRNGFAPGEQYRGQPEAFPPGTVDEAVVVTGIANDLDLAWTVDTGNGSPSTATARADFATKCSVEPPPNPEPGPEPPVPPHPGPPDPTREPIGVFAQCATQTGSTYSAVFGYQNDNEDSVLIPVGDDNRFVPGGDRGQITTFLPGSHLNAFTVDGIPSTSLASWVVTYAGAKRFATTTGLPACSQGPQPVQPIGIFACVVDHGGTFDAVFGYDNPNPVDETVPIGLQNRFQPHPIDRGQPTLFNPGRHEAAFVVRGIPSAGALAWTLAVAGTRTVVVTADYSQKCPQPELRRIAVFPLCVHRTGASYTAMFGYVNLNRLPVVVPVGVSNFVGPRPVDRGQPRVFRAGISWFAFSVREIPIRSRITWTVRDHGVVSRARASVQLGRNCVTTPVDPDVNVELDKSVEPNSTTVGDRLVYRIVARNEGVTTAQNTTVVDRTLDDRVTLLSATPSQGSCHVLGRRDVECRLGSLERGASATIVIAARARSPGVTRDRAIVTSLPSDGGPDNADRVTVVVAAAHFNQPKPKPPFTG